MKRQAAVCLALLVHVWGKKMSTCYDRKYLLLPNILLYVWEGGHG